MRTCRRNASTALLSGSALRCHAKRYPAPRSGVRLLAVGGGCAVQGGLWRQEGLCKEGRAEHPPPRGRERGRIPDVRRGLRVPRAAFLAIFIMAAVPPAPFPLPALRILLQVDRMARRFSVQCTSA